jgi:hypothetical protein
MMAMAKVKFIRVSELQSFIAQTFMTSIQVHVCALINLNLTPLQVQHPDCDGQHAADGEIRLAPGEVGVADGGVERQPHAGVRRQQARQGRREQELMKIEARFDGRGNPYYWIAFERPKFKAGEGTDLEAVAQSRISVTPLRLDLTDEPALAHFVGAFG